MTVPQQTINMTTIFNCADCRKAIKENSREHDDCWTNMEKDDDLWYCADCKSAHMDEDEEEVVVGSVCCECGVSTQGRKIRSLWNNTLCEECGEESDDDKEECDCCGENFETVCLTIAEDAEGEEEKYCATCLLLKIDDGCVWQVASGEWAC